MSTDSVGHITHLFGSGTLTAPVSESITSTGISLWGYSLTVEGVFCPGLIVNGTSNIDYSTLFGWVQNGGMGTGLGLENDGHMNLWGSTLEVGSITGTGNIDANYSTIQTRSAATSETIALHSSNLYIGWESSGQPSGMQFLAPITGFSASSAIYLDNTEATSAVITQAAGQPTIQDLELFNGATEVANLRISGSQHLFASDISPAGVGSEVEITSYNTGIALPGSH